MFRFDTTRVVMLCQAFLIALLMVALFGCEPAADDTAGDDGATSNGATTEPEFDEDKWKPAEPPPPPPLNITWEGPPFSVSFDSTADDPPTYAAHFEVTVPTGGYSYRVDRADYFRGTLTLFVFLVRPSSDEVVTQAPETLKHTYDSGTRSIDQVLLYACDLERGTELPGGNYPFKLAAKSP